MPSQDNIVYQNDMKFGFGEEERLQEILEKYFGVLRLLEKYSAFDYENEFFLIELKSRRINHNKYPTAMVNYSKLQNSSDSNKKRVVIFNYLDGLYVWFVNDDEYTIGTGGRCDRGCAEFSTMAYIPHEKLIKLEVLEQCNLHLCSAP